MIWDLNNSDCLNIFFSCQENSKVWCRSIQELYVLYKTNSFNTVREKENVQKERDKRPIIDRIMVVSKIQIYTIFY